MTGIYFVNGAIDGDPYRFMQSLLSRALVADALKLKFDRRTETV